MWICSTLGFYSIVNKGGGWHVRARVLADLVNLLRESSVKAQILTWESADYRFRVVLAESQVAAVFAALEKSIDYPNFKGRIHSLPGQRAKTAAYTSFWAHMAALQCQAPPG